jgi:hypothetical protein
MMLLEPGTKIEGDTEKVLAALHRVEFTILCENGVPQTEAYDLAERHAARMLEVLTASGYVVRQLQDQRS